MWSKKGEGWKPLFAMLDSGTEENWVHPKIVRRFGFPVKKGLAIIYITCSGHRMPSEATVKATWSVEGSGQTNDNIFRVAPEEAPFEVLLGRSLQESEEIGYFSKSKAIQVLVAEKETVSIVAVHEWNTLADTWRDRSRKGRRESAEK